MNIDISHNIAAVKKSLGEAAKQVPFAASKAINRSLLNTQNWTVNDYLKSKFTLRAKGKPWYTPGMRFGFNIKFSNKRNLSGSVGSGADWLTLQERGGTKRVAGRLAIPTPFWKKREEIMAKAKKPATLLKDWRRSMKEEQEADKDLREAGNASGRKKRFLETRRNAARKRRRMIGGILFGGKPFIAKVRGKEGIFARESSKRLPIHKLFDLDKTAKVPAVFQWEPTGVKRIQQAFPVIFEEELTKAINSTPVPPKK